MRWRPVKIHRVWLSAVLFLLVGCFMSVEATQPLFLALPLQIRLPRAIFAASLTDLSIAKFGGEQTFFVKETKAHWRNWDSTLNLRFAWTTSQAGAVSAVYQVSTVPFPDDLENAMTPPGLVATGFAGAPPAEGERQVFYIDLRAFAPVPPGETRPSSTAGAVTAPAISPIVRAPAVKAPASVISAPGLFASKPRPSTYLAIVDYYIRIVTLSALARPVGVPSPPVKITYGELADGGQTIAYQGQNTLNHPSVAVIGYVPIQTEDPQAMYHYIVTHDIYLPVFGTIYYKGQQLDFTPEEGNPGFWESLWDSIGAAFSSATDFFRSAVNWCATAYEDIKGYAIDAAVIVAGEDARGMLTVGLEIGLAAMGIPPSIPNYDELTNLGKDYLVQAAADYTGLPPEATEAAVNAFLEEATRQANGGGNPNVWIKPDPVHAYRPAYLEVVARNSTSESSDPVFAQIAVQVPTLGHSDLFHSTYAYIPALTPGETISLRVYLEENYAMRDPDNPFGGESYYAGMHRFWDAYNNRSATVSVSTIGSPQSQNPTQGQQQLTVHDCRYTQSF